MINASDARSMAAQELLHKTIARCLKRYGLESTLEALSEQFGVTGATAVISHLMPASDFAGIHVLRAIRVCDQLCTKQYIEGVL